MCIVVSAIELNSMSHFPPLFSLTPYAGPVQVCVRHTRGAHCVRQNVVLRLRVIRTPQGEGAQGSGHQDEPLPARVCADLQTDTKVIACVG